MALYELDGVAPLVHPKAWVSPDATVIGRVEIAEGASIWPGAVLRGDGELIRIGPRTSVQDGTVVHTDAGFPCTVGAGVTVGHQVTLHGCTIGDDSLIGIQAVVLNGAVVGAGCLVGAGALVTERASFGDRQLILGTPAKAVRELTDAQLVRMREGAQRYVANGARYAAGLKRVG